jgi:hypothetical protein
VQAHVVEKHLEVGQQPVAAHRRHRQCVHVRSVVLQQLARDRGGVAGSALWSASQVVKRRSELVETATEAGDLVVVVIRQRAQRLASSRSQSGWMSAK